MRRKLLLAALAALFDGHYKNARIHDHYTKHKRG